jgi:hypothetical protein
MSYVEQERPAHPPHCGQQIVEQEPPQSNCRPQSQVYVFCAAQMLLLRKY